MGKHTVEVVEGEGGVVNLDGKAELEITEESLMKAG